MSDPTSQVIDKKAHIPNACIIEVVSLNFGSAKKNNQNQSRTHRTILNEKVISDNNQVGKKRLHQMCCFLVLLRTLYPRKHGTETTTVNPRVAGGENGRMTIPSVAVASRLHRPPPPPPTHSPSRWCSTVGVVLRAGRQAGGGGERRFSSWCRVRAWVQAFSAAALSLVHSDSRGVCVCVCV